MLCVLTYFVLLLETIRLQAVREYLPTTVELFGILLSNMTSPPFTVAGVSVGHDNEEHEFSYCQLLRNFEALSSIFY